MKRLIAALFLVICGMFCVQSIYADRIPSKGKWGQEDIRSIIPAPPVAFIEGHDLRIEFADPLSNLTVKVTDNTGAVVYEENITVSTPQSYTIPLSVQSGEYTLSLIHNYGTLTGSFVIE
ncbi:DUF3244 domain-containing protein [uncultured Parabacteroides sp.]|uniref:DUF3244 domain-containing protein n=1 Tax=uncultured Parabacteroides sp. TaxID=512312 RepID=UPI002583FA28|nr:DUF3244 domain-containing protein [uncultured Parabacteroides sp.]